VFPGSLATLDFYLHNFTDSNLLADEIRNLTYRGGLTNMDDALRLARTLIFDTANGDRPHAPNVIILVTDGRPGSTASVINEVSIIKRLGIRIVGIGVGSGVSSAESWRSFV